jgi:ribonuclease Z
MRFTFLGTGGGVPTRARNVTSVALQPSERQGGAPLFLFDCGEGTQHQFLRVPHLKLNQIERVFFTHLHGDHLFGLPGLLASRALADNAQTPVALHGPRALADYLRGVAAATGARAFGGAREPHVISAPGVVYEDDYLTVVCAKVRHGIEAYAYAVIERDQPGRFDVEQARSLGIPPGPLYGRLKAGESVALPDGRIIDGRTLTGPTRRGAKWVFSGDTIFSPALAELARGADVLVHEATYAQADLPLAERALHSTSVMAARTAREAGVGLLYLTHFSPRYEAGGSDGPTLETLLAEARAVFPNTRLAHDLLTYEIARPNEAPAAPHSEPLPQQP